MAEQLQLYALPSEVRELFSLLREMLRYALFLLRQELRLRIPAKKTF